MSAASRKRIAQLMAGAYNRRRRHSSIGYLSAIDYEHRHQGAAVDHDAHRAAAGLELRRRDPHPQLTKCGSVSWPSPLPLTMVEQLALGDYGIRSDDVRIVSPSPAITFVGTIAPVFT
jgi:hypothetical protein